MKTSHRTNHQIFPLRPTGIKIIKYFTTFTLIVFALMFVLRPSSAYNVGNIFFGQVPKLYNVAFAHFFFTQAAYPVLSQKVPQFAHYQLSRTSFIRGYFGLALTEAKNELALYPENTQTYYILGLTHGYMNNEKDAIDAFSAFIDSHPASWAARNDKAWLQFRLGDVDGALVTILPVTMNTTNNPWVQNTYGTLLMNKGRYDEARVALRYAKAAASKMTERTWGTAYPGNDPRVYGMGLREMRDSIENNLQLLESK